MIAEFKKAFVDLLDKNFVINHYNELIDSLNTGFKNITFKENFKSFQTDVTIAASQELEIKHRLGAIPDGYIVLKNNADSVIIDGATEWTNQSIYIKNVGSSQTDIRILILK